MYHKTYFPNAKRKLERFEDANGFIPEVGDNFEDFDWSRLSDEDEAYLREEWDDYCNQADAVTQEAEREVQAWRNGKI